MRTWSPFVSNETITLSEKRTLTCRIGQGDIQAGSGTRAVPVLSLLVKETTLSYAIVGRAGFGLWKKLINFFFSLQKQSGPLKKKFKSHHRKPKNFKKATNGK